jgi:replicative DNA helicase
MERELRYQILRASVRDRTFLKSSWRDIQPENFPEREERIIAETAVAFYEKYQEPVGALIRSEADDLAHQKKVGSEGRKKLKDLLDLILGAKMELVPVKALEDRLKTLKVTSFYESAVEEIITAQEKGELSAHVLADLVDKANKELSLVDMTSSDYFNELEQRIDLREHHNGTKYPLLGIGPLDEKIKGVPRKGVGMFMAPFKGGKGLALLHVATAYALQGYSSLIITLEDPKDLVESRLDSTMTGIPLNYLTRLPNKLRRRFEEAKEKMRGKIRVIDGTDGGWTITRVEQAWEQHKQHGFTADCIVIDYDDEIECERNFKGEHARRFEFAEIYRRMRRMAAKLDIIVWTAAQGTRASEGVKVLTGKYLAEDISKIRKVWLGIGIGTNKDDEKVKHLYVLGHKDDRSHFGVDVVSDFQSAIFFDAEATARYQAQKKREEL